MSDVQKYIEARSKRDLEFAEGFELGYTDFKIGVVLRKARESAGMTQEQVAKKLRTRKSAISRIENHADDVRLSTLRRYAKAVGASLSVKLTS
jgi:HTH-type transcriptional regulator/antitoxin HipB